MAAPILGGALLTFTSWRGAFVLLAGLGCVNLVLSCLLTETLPQNSRYQGKLLQSFSLLAGFVKYKRFFRLLIVLRFVFFPVRS